PIRVPPINPRPPPCLTCPPETYQFATELLFEYSTDDGRTWIPGRADTQTSVRVAMPTQSGDTRFFDTEMLQLDIRGGTLPTGVMARESPTRASTGKTRVQQLATSFVVNSFFDVFLELSVNNGQTWGPASASSRVDLMAETTP